jgi:hypothetical protein
MRYSNTKLLKEHLAADSLSAWPVRFYTALRAAQFFSSPFSLFLLEHQLANFAAGARRMPHERPGSKNSRQIG